MSMTLEKINKREEMVGKEARFSEMVQRSVDNQTRWLWLKLKCSRVQPGMKWAKDRTKSVEPVAETASAKDHRGPNCSWKWKWKRNVVLLALTSHKSRTNRLIKEI
jgi:hypothetical protein